ncbi:hypothetical protein SUGI_0980930 [Cryptomeria japonica]|uniref:U-box domain-containing protein 12-like n=1 Tax=Cryptomeria japonica TaxID=3369 RepID=UPI002414CC46|nr:U-box domain-containing protein 12-like [Cryptomeria japonica]GLJ46548.1 hypothetical protein SUGI_0980930 [Cryptomeria japonica]
MTEAVKGNTAMDDYISNIGSQDGFLRIQALEGLKKLTRLNEENRNWVAHSKSAIPSLLELLSSSSSCEDDLKTKELALAILLNLSVNDNLKEYMGSLEAIQCISNLIRYSDCSGSEELRENGASALCSLAVVDKNKGKMGVGGAIEALVTMLQADPPLGAALNALTELLIYNGNKALAVRAGAVPTLFNFLQDDNLAESSLAVLALVVAHMEGKKAISNVSGWMGALVDCIKSKGMQSKENATAILLEMLEYYPEKVREADKVYDICSLLIRLSINGSSNVRRNASLLMKMVEMEFESYAQIGTHGYASATDTGFESDVSSAPSSLRATSELTD